LDDIAEHRQAQLAVENERLRLQTILKASSDGIHILNAEGVLVEANEAFLNMLGYDESVVGKLHVAEWDAQDSASVIKMRNDDLIIGRAKEIFETRHRRKDGSCIDVEISACGIEIAGVEFLFAASRDITDRKHAEAARQEALSRLQKISSRLPGIVFQFLKKPDGTFSVPYASDAIREIYRVNPEDICEDATPVFAFIHPEDLPSHIASIEESAKLLLPWHQEYRLLFPEEPVVWLLGNAIPQHQPDGSVLWHGFITDITERKQQESALAIAATVFESQEGMVITDPNGLVLQVNKAFTGITGYVKEDVVAKKMNLVKSGRHDNAFYKAMWAEIQSIGSWSGEIWNRRKNGEIYPQWLTITAVWGSNGRISNYVGTLTDITLRKTAEDEINHLAFYDPLTRLPNRRLLMDRLRQTLAVSTRTRRLGALMFIDLDNFKVLNDTLGHDVGDLLLQQVARRLASCIREGDTVSRFGGDEFVIMLEDLSEHAKEAANLTEMIGLKVLSSLNTPYQLLNHYYHCTTSIGATLINGQRDSVEDLLKQADLAMYQSKAAGRNTLRFFDHEMQVAVMARAALETELREGLARQEFVLYYQPQVDGTGSITGAEALVRWQHPSRGLILPSQFIELAEETNLILTLGNWVLRTACDQLLRWAGKPQMAHLTLSVNVSARQFHQPDFVSTVFAALDDSGADPKKLKLELTESVLLNDIENIVTRMTTIKSRGIGFSLDDFGTGYSSLSYLKRLPMDQLKIDPSFVRDIYTNSDDAAIAQTIVALAKNMGLSVIAEGVETEEQRGRLAENGCHQYQGYLFSHPLPLLDLERFLHQGKGVASGTVDLNKC
jgi:diguanylate cyclase (GGDEF)-like protein/PAS domain S-box-containing protein